jgi:hypothetical protein
MLAVVLHRIFVAAKSQAASSLEQMFVRLAT